ncbi:Coiled-coil domain-containing protein 25 [Penicillium chermesinum]|uniref:Coiled-coil domain-containing protein 25 n=1 Tax=Penicillium chermesinum TaxID=63820 RepID=A0A9W9PJN1_9EURO|nr:Coiled-coil domain-containing protein 25 [Penicillium chermesinum]KAJ5248671.1 Coiled-coil domain-containing protein 25 [Penicillium chermesinum]
MVYYFTSNVVSPAAFIYVGKDKFENESLIEFGLDQDVCSSSLTFCLLGSVFPSSILVDLPISPNGSNATHSSTSTICQVPTYISECAMGKKWDSIPQELLDDCAQLTKANSIEGNKKDNVTIIYTPWSNLMKDGSMATGQVSFHNPKMVRKILVRERENAVVNRLNKTRVEKFPDLRAEKEEDGKKRRRDERKQREQQRHKDNQEKREREQLKWQKEHAYDDMFSAENMEANSNQDRAADWEDDFM